MAKPILSDELWVVIEPLLVFFLHALQNNGLACLVVPC